MKKKINKIICVVTALTLSITFGGGAGTTVLAQQTAVAQGVADPVINSTDENYLVDEQAEARPLGYEIGLPVSEHIQMREQSDMAIQSIGLEPKIIVGQNVESGSCGTGVVWSLNNSVLKISGEGEMDDYVVDAPAPWRSFAQNIKSVVIESGVTKIGEQAFEGCCNMKTIEIPDTVTTLGSAAFYGCSALEKVDIPDAVEELPSGLFVQCTALKEVTARGVVSIQDYAFQDVTFSEFEIGSNTTTISPLAFYNSQIKEFSMKGNNPVYTVKDGVLFTDDEKTLFSFPCAKDVSSYVIPSSVTKVGDMAFITNCCLEEITIPNSVTILGESAFQACDLLRTIEIPDSVTEAGDFTFYSCNSLKSVKFGNGLHTTSYQMFRECGALEDIDFGTGLEVLGAHTFAYCTSLKQIKLPENIKEIESGTFGECFSLQSFQSTALENIPYQCFLNDSALVNLDLNEGMKDISRCAFLGCWSLEEVTLPESVEYVHSFAFETTTNLIPKNSELSAFGKNGLRKLEFLTVDVSRDYENAYAVLKIVNEERTKEGLAPVMMNESLLETAMQRAGEIAVLFSHTRPDGSSCFDLNTLMSGENIAYGDITPEKVMNSWMNSEGHRANILTGGYTTIGIGCAYVNGGYYWVQCFGTGEDQTDCESPQDRQLAQTVQIATEEFNEADTTYGIIFGSPETYLYESKMMVENISARAGETINATYYLRNPGTGICRSIRMN